MQPTFTGFPSGAFHFDHTFLSAHCAANGSPFGIGWVGYVCWAAFCGTFRSGIPRIGLPFRRSRM